MTSWNNHRRFGTIPFHKFAMLDEELNRLDAQLQSFDLTMRAHRLTRLDSKLYSLECRTEALEWRMRIMQKGTVALFAWWLLAAFLWFWEIVGHCRNTLSICDKRYGIWGQKEGRIEGGVGNRQQVAVGGSLVSVDVHAVSCLPQSDRPQHCGFSFSLLASYTTPQHHK